jgi:MFS family permease
VRHANFHKTIKKSELTKKWRTREIILDKNFYIYLPLSLAAPFISTGLMFHQIFIINQKNWTLEMFVGGYILLGLFSIIGLAFGGPIIDKFNTKKIIIFTLLPLFLGIITLVFFKNYISMFVYLSLLGLNMGIGAPFIGSLWAELYGIKSIGNVKALLHALTVFASALSPVIFGYIIDIGMGIKTISLISVIIIIFATILSIIYQNS